MRRSALPDQSAKWEGAVLQPSDRLIIQYSRDGGASWFSLAQNIPALSFSYSWHVENFPATQGRMKEPDSPRTLHRNAKALGYLFPSCPSFAADVGRGRDW